MSIDNKDPVKEDTPETTGSSPEAEQQPATNGTGNNANAAPENQQPKRKGGRKPVSQSFLVICFHSLSTYCGFNTIFPQTFVCVTQS